jgi:hypothetical protein
VIKHNDSGDGESTDIRLTGRASPDPDRPHRAGIHSPHYASVCVYSTGK